MTIYRFFLLLHVVSGFGFIMAHAASAYAIFMVRRERDRERICFWLQLSHMGKNPAILSLSLILLTGITMMVMSGWWRYGWPWASLGMIVAIRFGMARFASGYMKKLRAAVSMPEPVKTGPEFSALIPQTGGPISQWALEKLVATGRPKLVASIGLGGLTLILYMMLFKPF